MNAPFVVLVAEDDVLVRNLINIVLSRAGYSILLASDGEEALQLSRQYKGEIHLLLSDVMMPKMNGITLVHLIRKERPQTRALIISGKMSSEIVQGNVRFDFLRKPFLPLQLTEKIKAMFESPGLHPEIQDL